MQKLNFRKLIVLSIATITLFFGQIINAGNSLLAQSSSITPEGDYYQVAPEYAGKGPVNSVKETVKNATENVVEKLNLNEPLPPETKNFINQVEDSVGNTAKPMTGNQEGYFDRENTQIRR
ncbi:hypothetical protein IQ264_21385 [Phormidium sp. LEGE 05292]|uniref:hypothetical protein n=1 Tax=[Phormidium] sp. LEGE 05292 TaxID=767427 RepID=UPI001881ED86|nr:hypothetical protein [Phormidium sp. LEGE 05292]MBE9227980.1 hypothetical protein [Phormidium sp. LEGE 05292]